MPPLPELPATLSLVGSLLVFVIAGVAARLGWKAKPDPANAHHPADAVVVAASFADGAVIRQLLAAIQSLDLSVHGLRGLLREGADEQARTTRAVARLQDMLEERLPDAREGNREQVRTTRAVTDLDAHVQQVAGVLDERLKTGR